MTTTTHTHNASNSHLINSPTCGELYSHALELKSRNNWTEIVNAFHPLSEKFPDVSTDPNRHQLLSETAFALSQLQRFEEAIAVLKDCLSLSSNSYMYLSALAFNYYNALVCDKSREIRLGDRKNAYFDHALSAFASAQQEYPDNIVDYYRNGMLYVQIKAQYKKAIPLFEKAVENWEKMTDQSRKARHKDLKNYIKALYNLGKANLDCRRFSQALASAQKCIQADEKTNYEQPVHKFYQCGKIYMAMGNLEEAIKHLKVAANQKTNRPKDYVFELIARCFFMQNRFDEALKWIERIPYKFRKPYVLRLQGLVLAKAGNLKEGVERLSEAVKKDRKGKHKTLLAWGLLMLERKDYAKAIELFGRANAEMKKQFANEYISALYYTGVCSLEMGKPEEAVAWFKKTISLDPNHYKAGEALKHLSRQNASIEKPLADNYIHDEVTNELSNGANGNGLNCAEA